MKQLPELKLPESTMAGIMFILVATMYTIMGWSVSLTTLWTIGIVWIVIGIFWDWIAIGTIIKIYEERGRKKNDSR